MGIYKMVKDLFFKKSTFDLRLIDAVKTGDINMVNALLTQGLSPNDHQPCDPSALIIACNEGFEEIAQLLIEYGADINYGDDSGDTPLIAAVVYGSQGIVRLLLQAGAKKNLKNRFGVTAIDYAKGENGKEDILKILMSDSV